YGSLGGTEISLMPGAAVAAPAVAVPPTPPAPKPSAAPTRAHVPLTAAEERSLKPEDIFKECAQCPEMVVLPAGEFMMGTSPAEIESLKQQVGSSQDEIELLARRYDEMYGREVPQHRVKFERPFAVGRFEVTFAEFRACYRTTSGGCYSMPTDE